MKTCNLECLKWLLYGKYLGILAYRIFKLDTIFARFTIFFFFFFFLLLTSQFDCAQIITDVADK